MSFDIVEIQRRLANLVRVGTVSEVNAETGAARVKLTDKLTTAFLPWFSLAGDAKSWSCPTVGEQVVILSPAGSLEQGFIVGSLYSLAFAAPSNKQTTRKISFADGSFCEYDESSKTMKVNAANVVATAPFINLDGNVKCRNGQTNVLTSADGRVMTFTDGILTNVAG